MMRTRAKMKIVASDRARRENVPRHILFYLSRTKLPLLSQALFPVPSTSFYRSFLQFSTLYSHITRKIHGVILQPDFPVFCCCGFP